MELEFEKRRQALIDKLLFDETQILLRGSLQQCVVGLGNTMVYGDCLGPRNPRSDRYEPYENFSQGYGLEHSFYVTPIFTANDEKLWETDRERAIRMGYFLEELWKDKGNVEDHA